MNDLVQHLEQENEALKQDLAQCRRAAADHSAELKAERDSARSSLGEVSDLLAAEREARKGLANDLARMNDRWRAATAQLDDLRPRLRSLEGRGRLLVQAVLEGTDRQAYEAAADLEKVLERGAK